jgi:prevent-host-death family protein
MILSEAASSSAAADNSASKANRSFSCLLRQVVQGQRFTVLSHGRPVATIAPATEGLASRRASRLALLARLTTQPATSAPRSWQRDELYD